jgi:hypothetical protein
VLELTFMSLLGLMIVLVGLFAVVVVTRLVEPRGLKVLLRRLARR